MAEWAVTTAGAALEFDTVKGVPTSACIIDSSHFLHIWFGTDNDGFCQIFEVNTSTWAVATSGSRLEIDTEDLDWSWCGMVDSNHALVFFMGASIPTGFAQVVEINTSTWEITTANSRLSFGQVATMNKAVRIDTNHYVNFYAGASNDGFCQVFEINTSTWAVTTAGALFEFDTTFGEYPYPVLIDANHAIVFWSAETYVKGKAQIIEINTSSWACATSSSILEFETNTNYYNVALKIDETHVLNVWGTDTAGKCQIFAINTSTWAITTAGNVFVFDTTYGADNTCQLIDTNHFINFYYGEDTYTGHCLTFAINTSTWEITTESTKLEFDTVQGYYNQSIKIDTSHFVNFWSGDGDDGFVQVFSVELPAVTTTTTTLIPTTTTTTTTIPTTTTTTTTEIIESVPEKSYKLSIGIGLGL